MLYPIVNQNVDWFSYNQQQQQHYRYSEDGGGGYDENVRMIDPLISLPKSNEMLMEHVSYVDSDCGSSFNQTSLVPFVGGQGYGGGIGCNMNVQSPVSSTMGYPNIVNNVGGMFGDGMPPPFPPPCQGPQPWSYAQCYGFYGDAPCQYVDIIDMEDFM